VGVVELDVTHATARRGHRLVSNRLGADDLWKPHEKPKDETSHVLACFRSNTWRVPDLQRRIQVRAAATDNAASCVR
jgi:hypothetical protein